MRLRQRIGWYLNWRDFPAQQHFAIQGANLRRHTALGLAVFGRLLSQKPIAKDSKIEES